jgi:DNA-binding FrmR family transcriptional regulator
MTSSKSLARLKWRLVASAVAFVSASVPVAAWSGNPSETLRTIFTSSEWSLPVHLLVFFIIFFGILVKPLKDRFDRAGVAVAVAFALMLSASLAFSGRFDLLHDLEPIAGIGLFVLFGAVVGLAFHRLYSASWATAGCLSYVVVYTSIELASPSLMPALDQFIIIPNFLYALTVVWLIYSAAKLAFPDSNPASSWMTHAARTLAARPPQARQRFREEIQAQEELDGTVEINVQDHAQLLAEIDETQRILKKSSADDPELRSVISGRLAQLGQAQRKVEAAYATYKAQCEHLERMDAVEYADLRLAELPDSVQSDVRDELAGLKKKLSVDRVLENLGSAVEANNIAVRDALNRAKAELAAGHTRACLGGLNDARTAEAEAVRLEAQIKRFAGQLKGAATKVVMTAQSRAGEPAMGR